MQMKPIGGQVRVGEVSAGSRVAIDALLRRQRTCVEMVSRVGIEIVEEFKSDPLGTLDFRVSVPPKLTAAGVPAPTVVFTTLSEECLVCLRTHILLGSSTQSMSGPEAHAVMHKRLPPSDQLCTDDSWPSRNRRVRLRHAIKHNLVLISELNLVLRTLKVVRGLGHPYLLAFCRQAGGLSFVMPRFVLFEATLPDALEDLSFKERIAATTLLPPATVIFALGLFKDVLCSADWSPEFCKKLDDASDSNTMPSGSVTDPTLANIGAELLRQLKLQPQLYLQDKPKPESGSEPESASEPDPAPPHRWPRRLDIDRNNNNNNNRRSRRAIRTDKSTDTDRQTQPPPQPPPPTALSPEPPALISASLDGGAPRLSGREKRKLERRRQRLARLQRPRPRQLTNELATRLTMRRWLRGGVPEHWGDIKRLWTNVSGIGELERTTNAQKDYIASLDDQHDLQSTPAVESTPAGPSTPAGQSTPAGPPTPPISSPKSNPPTSNTGVRKYVPPQRRRDPYAPAETKPEAETKLEPTPQPGQIAIAAKETSKESRSDAKKSRADDGGSSGSGGSMSDVSGAVAAAAVLAAAAAAATVAAATASRVGYNAHGIAGVSGVSGVGGVGGVGGREARLTMLDDTNAQVVVRDTATREKALEMMLQIGKPPCWAPATGPRLFIDATQDRMIILLHDEPPPRLRLNDAPYDWKVSEGDGPIPASMDLKIGPIYLTAHALQSDDTTTTQPKPPQTDTTTQPNSSGGGMSGTVRYGTGEVVFTTLPLPLLLALRFHLWKTRGHLSVKDAIDLCSRMLGVHYNVWAGTRWRHMSRVARIQMAGLAHLDIVELMNLQQTVWHAWKDGRTHVLALVFHAPLMMICQQFVLFETAMCSDENPFPSLSNPDAYARQCVHIMMTHYVDEDRVEISKPCPLFARDRGPIPPNRSDHVVIQIDSSQMIPPHQPLTQTPRVLTTQTSDGGVSKVDDEDVFVVLERGSLEAGLVLPPDHADRMAANTAADATDILNRINVGKMVNSAKQATDILHRLKSQLLRPDTVL